VRDAAPDGDFATASGRRATIKSGRAQASGGGSGARVEIR